MIVTIDGPAGAGKSTVARALAARLGFEYLDTGAMYRAVALAGLRRGVDWNEPGQLAALALTLSIEPAGDRMVLDGEDVSLAIRTQEVTEVTRYAADNVAIREHLVAQQRRWAASRNVVTEGRDQGTLVFPDAACKIYLTASARQRAERRLRDLESQGERATLASVLAAQAARDLGDAARDVGRLAKAPDAIEVSTDGLSIDEVVDRLAELVQARRG